MIVIQYPKDLDTIRELAKLKSLKHLDYFKVTNTFIDDNSICMDVQINDIECEFMHISRRLSVEIDLCIEQQATPQMKQNVLNYIVIEANNLLEQKRQLTLREFGVTMSPVT